MKGWPRYDPELTEMLYGPKPPYLALVVFLALCVLVAKAFGT